jgi:hypothetical protein
MQMNCVHPIEDYALPSLVAKINVLADLVTATRNFALPHASNSEGPVHLGALRTALVDTYGQRHAFPCMNAVATGTGTTGQICRLHRCRNAWKCLECIRCSSLWMSAG